MKRSHERRAKCIVLRELDRMLAHRALVTPAQPGHLG
ncbi:hypothetical protein LDDCCGHA_4363 [Methylobacterium oxalidis]|nr:hypothetical protein LDDCCGHA_4363 [Methylobacterium oxalidis]